MGWKWLEIGLAEKMSDAEGVCSICVRCQFSSCVQMFYLFHKLKFLLSLFTFTDFKNKC